MTRQKDQFSWEKWDDRFDKITDDGFASIRTATNLNEVIEAAQVFSDQLDNLDKKPLISRLAELINDIRILVLRSARK